MKDTQLILGKRQLSDLGRCHPMIFEVLEAARAAWPVARMYVGDMHRTLAEEEAIARQTGTRPSGIHAALPVRAVDLSGRNLGGSVEDRWRACGRVAGVVNRQFTYDPRRLGLRVAVGAKHGTGPHVHLQVHAGTVHRGG